MQKEVWIHYNFYQHLMHMLMKKCVSMNDPTGGKCKPGKHLSLERKPWWAYPLPTTIPIPPKVSLARYGHQPTPSTAYTTLEKIQEKPGMERWVTGWQGGRVTRLSETIAVTWVRWALGVRQLVTPVVIFTLLCIFITSVTRFLANWVTLSTPWSKNIIIWNLIHIMWALIVHITAVCTAYITARSLLLDYWLGGHNCSSDIVHIVVK